MERTFVKGIVAGAILGSIVGLMIAPKTGKEARNLVAWQAGQAKHKAGKALGNIKTKMGKKNHDVVADSRNAVGATNVFED